MIYFRAVSGTSFLTYAMDYITFALVTGKDVHKIKKNPKYPYAQI